MAEIVSEAWLKKQGIALPKSRLQELVAKTQEECEMRVGYILIDAFTEEQVTEFERLCDSGQEDEMTDYLSKVYPDYPKVARRMVRALRKEIRQTEDKVRLIESWPSSRAS